MLFPIVDRQLVKILIGIFFGLVVTAVVVIIFGFSQTTEVSAIATATPTKTPTKRVTATPTPSSTQTDNPSLDVPNILHQQRFLPGTISESQSETSAYRSAKKMINHDVGSNHREGMFDKTYLTISIIAMALLFLGGLGLLSGVGILSSWICLLRSQKYLRLKK